MSSTLYWERVERGHNDLSFQLKKALRKELGCSFMDGILAESDTNILAFLRGLGAAGVKDANVLADAITKYGKVRIFEET